MKLAISGVEQAYEERPIRCLLGDARSHGVAWIELIHPRNTMADGVDATIDLINEAGLSVAAVSTWTHMIWPGDVSLQQQTLMQAIKIAARVGARFVNTYFGHAHQRDDAALIAAYAERIAPCLELAERQGVTLLIENECDVDGEDPAWSDVTRRPDAMRTLVEKVNSPHFRVTFDACNAYLDGIEPFPYAYSVLADVIAYVHVKDATIYCPDVHTGDRRVLHSQGKPYVCIAAGLGGINHEGLLRQLWVDGYEGFLTLEPHVPPSRLSETLAASIRYLRQREYVV